ncbi:MAG: DUF6265 family protein [Fulvivirga sp.]
MKYASIRQLSVALLLIFGLYACNQTSSDADYTWLIGQWQRIDMEDGQIAFESWQLQNNQLEGIGCTMEGNDTVFVEYLSIYKNNGKYLYTADVAHNPEAVAFEITPTDKGFICVNEKHDFPNKISYTQNGDSLVVFISDMSEENKRFFRFVRKE